MSSQGRDLPGHVIHFFKMIEENSLRNGELRIPRSFVSKYWQGISKPIFLRLPNGAKWGVNWIKRDGDVWLSNGWKKFAEYYSLDQEHFLVFRYEGKSQFQVVILDRSALEIDYPLFKGTNDGEESGNSFEVFDGFSPRQSKRPNSPSPFSHTRKKTKTNPKEEPKCYTSQHVETKGAQYQRTKLEKKNFHADFDTAKPKNRGGRGGIYAKRKCSKSEAIRSEELLEDFETISALERAKAFSSKNPFFIREMHPTYIQKHILVIPGNFITSHLQKDGSATLWVSEERTWDVKFKLNPCNGQIILSTGWKTFVEDNNLKLGDVCVFELTKCAEVSVRVVIFRAREESSPPLFEAYGDGANRRKQTTGLQNNFAERGSEGIQKKSLETKVFDDSEFPRSSKFLSENHFTLFLKPTQLNSTNIPIDFVRKYVIHNVQDVTLRVGKRSWPVKLDYYPKHSYAKFSAGWSAFVRDCNLKAGDVCLFELIDMENLVLEVKVSRRIN